MTECLPQTVERKGGFAHSSEFLVCVGQASCSREKEKDVRRTLHFLLSKSQNRAGLGQADVPSKAPELVFT